MEKAINLTPKNEIKLTPKKYLSLDAKARHKIRSIKFVPPSIGDKNFGYFIATLKHPVYLKR